MKSTITLLNSYHYSEVRIRCEVENNVARLTKSQIKRAKRELCGFMGCHCSDEAGRRGEQDFKGELDTSALWRK